MENHYEYLKLDMSASIDEIRDAIELNKNNDEARIRKIKSILLNERFKSEYDEKLISYLINNGDSSRKADEKKQSLYIEQIKNLDNGSCITHTYTPRFPVGFKLLFIISG